MSSWAEKAEQGAKAIGAFVAALLLWRPLRRARAAVALENARRVLLVRLDNRVGEALLLTPLLSTLKRSAKGFRVEALVHPKVSRVLEGHPEIDRLIPFNGTRLWMGPWAPGIRTLRREAYDVVVHCTNWTAPSVSGAIIARLVSGGAPVIGPAHPPVALLSEFPVKALPDVASEVLQRLHLLHPLNPGVAVPVLSFRPGRGTASIQLPSRPFALVNPGGRLGWRRIPPSAFAAAANALLRGGLQVIVSWGPGEQSLAEEVVRSAPGSELAPPTDLDQLAALMAVARLTVCNNTGPMHLSVAVGTPTLGLFVRIDMARWGHPQSPHRMVDLTAAVTADHPLEPLIVREVEEFVRALGGSGI